MAKKGFFKSLFGGGDDKRDLTMSDLADRQSELDREMQQLEAEIQASMSKSSQRPPQQQGYPQQPPGFQQQRPPQQQGYPPQQPQGYPPQQRPGPAPQQAPPGPPQQQSQTASMGHDLEPPPGDDPKDKKEVLDDLFAVQKDTQPQEGWDQEPAPAEPDAQPSPQEPEPEPAPSSRPVLGGWEVDDTEPAYGSGADIEPPPAMPDEEPPPSMPDEEPPPEEPEPAPAEPEPSPPGDAFEDPELANIFGDVQARAPPPQEPEPEEPAPAPPPPPSGEVIDNSIVDDLFAPLSSDDPGGMAEPPPQPPEANIEVLDIECYNCGNIVSLKITERPFTMKCDRCGAEGVIE